MSEQLPVCKLCGADPHKIHNMVFHSDAIKGTARCEAWILPGMSEIRWRTLMSVPTLAELERKAWKPASEKPGPNVRQIMVREHRGVVYLRSFYEDSGLGSSETHWREMPEGPEVKA